MLKALATTKVLSSGSKQDIEEIRLAAITCKTTWHKQRETKVSTLSNNWIKFKSLFQWLGCTSEQKQQKENSLMSAWRYIVWVWHKRWKKN